jgi:plasmid stabilization system protein ParE
MAEVVWTEPALNDLDAIADYIALDNPQAARRFLQRVFAHVDQLASHPKSGSVPRELAARAIAKSSSSPAGCSTATTASEYLSFTSSAEKDSCASVTFVNGTAELDPISPRPFSATGKAPVLIGVGTGHIGRVGHIGGT